MIGKLYNFHILTPVTINREPRQSDRIVRAGVHIIASMNTRIPKGLTAADMRLSVETIAEMKRRGTIIIPTVAVARYHLQARPEDREALFTVIRDNLTRLKAAGNPMLAGSDLFDGSVRDKSTHCLPRTLLRRLSCYALQR